ncbi:MAG: hypothetical protein JWO37_1447 [Acidimicrobiales bacterium]|nr:hypothetical protein [Acidimicrobiales bacterium]
MQKLHLVGFTTDHEALIFSARKGARSGGFVVPLDAALVATINDIIRRRDGADAETVELPGPANRPHRRPAPESSLTPREIQARIRAGRSIAEVAGEAGVDEEWVERFAVPIIAEQKRIVDRVRGLQYGKPRLGPSAQPLGVAVGWNLRDKGVSLGDEEFEQAWSAFQHPDGSWSIRFAYRSRSRKQLAEWELDVDGELVARNRLASELAYVEPGRRRRRGRVVGDPVDQPATPARKAARRKKAAPRKAAAARKATAKKKGTRKPPARKKATSRKVPAKKKVAARKTAPTAAPPRRATVAVRRSSTGTGSRRPRPLRAR